jgi:hypothetical protein
MLPSVVGTRPITALPSVVLPQPDSPTMPIVSLSLTLKLTPSTALTSPTRFIVMPPWIG